MKSPHAIEPDAIEPEAAQTWRTFGGMSLKTTAGRIGTDESRLCRFEHGKLQLKSAVTAKLRKVLLQQLHQRALAIEIILEAEQSASSSRGTATEESDV